MALIHDCRWRSIKGALLTPIDAEVEGSGLSVEEDLFVACLDGT
jgi:hypothetical protein